MIIVRINAMFCPRNRMGHCLVLALISKMTWHHICIINNIPTSWALHPTCRHKVCHNRFFPWHCCTVLRIPQLDLRMLAVWVRASINRALPQRFTLSKITVEAIHSSILPQTAPVVVTAVAAMAVLRPLLPTRLVKRSVNCHSPNHFRTDRIRLLAANHLTSNRNPVSLKFFSISELIILKHFTTLEPSPESSNQQSPRQVAVVGADEDYSYEFSADSSMFNDSYQCIRFQAFQQSTWHLLFDRNLKELYVYYFTIVIIIVGKRWNLIITLSVS